MIKAGFIGAGFVGSVNMENIRRSGFIEVNAVAEKNQKTAEEVAGRLRISKAYGNWEDLVADKVLCSYIMVAEVLKKVVSMIE